MVPTRALKGPTRVLQGGVPSGALHAFSAVWGRFRGHLVFRAYTILERLSCFSLFRAPVAPKRVQSATCGFLFRIFGVSCLNEERLTVKRIHIYIYVYTYD